MITIKSYYINMRRRWPLLPVLWNKFFNNLSDDYASIKTEIDDHAINTNEAYLVEKMTKYITKEGI